MKYYSEELNKIFATEADLVAAEKAEAERKAEIERKKAEKAALAKKTAEERKVRAKEVEAAHEEMVKAEEAYNKLVVAFVKDFGSYHMTYSSDSDLDGLIRRHLFKFI